MNKLRQRICGFAVVVCGLNAHANTVLDFESPLPAGLLPMSFWQGTAVGSGSLLADHFLAQGLRVEGGALVEAGHGHAASGKNALAGVSAQGLLDYDQAVSFSFFMQSNVGAAATTDYFAYSPDLGGGSGNTITLTAYDLSGKYVGEVSYVETGTFLSPLTLSGLGQFHRVVVDQSLINEFSGGIAIDLVTFGELTPSAVNGVAEPGALQLGLFSLLGAAGATVARRR